MKKTRTLLVGFVVILVFVLLNWLVYASFTPEMIHEFLRQFGVLAPIAYVISFAILPAFFFPVAVLALAGGLLFGLFWGSIYTLIGATINCALMFWMARSFARERVIAAVENRLSPTSRKILFESSEKHTFLLLIILRLIPVVPYNLINYSMGLCNIRFSNYMLASVIGIIPGTVVFINIGDKALSPGTPEFWLSLGLLVLLLAVTGVLAKILFPSNSEGVASE